MSSLSTSQTSVEEITTYLLAYLHDYNVHVHAKTLKLHRLDNEPIL